MRRSVARRDLSQRLCAYGYGAYAPSAKRACPEGAVLIAGAKPLYEAASVGKTFTAMVVMMLVESGSIALDDAIALKIAGYYSPELADSSVQPAIS